jgi:hypothetical protein
MTITSARFEPSGDVEEDDYLVFDFHDDLMILQRERCGTFGIQGQKL